MLYGNIRVVAPGSNMLMFRTNWERAEWYLRFGLGVLEEGNVLRLTFQPKGPGHAGDPYFLQEFKNMCVVCGTTRDLSHHHIVPDCYRRYFPRIQDNVGRWMYDVLLLCVACHIRYEEMAFELKTQISKEHGINPGGTTNLNIVMLRAIKAAAALYRHANKMPEARRKCLEADLKVHLGYNPEASGYRKIWKTLSESIEHVPAGKIVMEKVKDVDGFALVWRRHFLKTMKPAFLPEGWVPERKVYV